MERRFEFTPDPMTEILEGEVFVFGSNSDGIHGAGAAKFAKDKCGAIMGQDEGLQGNSYAIPTKDLKTGKALPLGEILISLCYFYDYAEQNPDKIFYLTKIGCGLAGLEIYEIKTLLKMVFQQAELQDTPILTNIVFPKEFV